MSKEDYDKEQALRSEASLGYVKSPKQKE